MSEALTRLALALALASAGCVFVVDGVATEDGAAGDGAPLDLGSDSIRPDLAGSDLGGADLAGLDLGARDLSAVDSFGDADVAFFGSACMGSCSGGLTCFTMADSSHSFQGGFCSKPCNGPSDCPAPATVCGQIEQTTLCLPVCDPAVGVSCRNGYSCCLDRVGPTSGLGACAISGSNYCGG